MIIRYEDGRTVEGILLSRSENRMRVALKGTDDVTEFTDIHGVWVASDCEPVQIEFAWQKKSGEPVVSVDDCICSHELAAHLIHLLLSGAEEESSKPLPLSADGYAAGSQLIM